LSAVQQLSTSDNVIPFRRPEREPFIAFERVPELIEWQAQLIHSRRGQQAYLIGQAYLCQAFERLRQGKGRFLHDRQAAFACGVTPCIYGRRRKEFAPYFAFVDEQIERAFARLRGQNPTQKRVVFSGEKRTKSTVPPAPDKTPTSKKGHKGLSLEGRRDDAPDAAPVAVASTAPAPQEPAKPAPAPLPEGWRPADPDLQKPEIAAIFADVVAFARANRLAVADPAAFWAFEKRRRSEGWR
jgi:hypothetical protein